MIRLLYQFPAFLMAPILATAVVAQEAPVAGPSQQTFHQTVRRVIEDVVVTDAQGHPVRGLAQSDFSITEDGAPQSVLSFEVHTMDSPAGPLAPAGLPAGTLINLPSQPQRGPLYVLVYDTIHMSGVEEQMFARQQLIKFVKERPAGTRFALIAVTDGIHLIQGFTADQQVLVDDLDAEHHTAHMPRAFLYVENFAQDNQQARAMIEILDYLHGVPGRKNVIWMASRFDLPLFASMGATDQQRDAQRLLDLLADEQIALYPVDTGGVAGGIQRMTEFQLQDAIAGATGGRAYHGDNDIVDELEKATDAGSFYYTLSYSPTNTVDNGLLRKIDIKLSKKGYQLFYRGGYYALSDEETGEVAENPNSGVPDDLAVWVRHGMPMIHDVLFIADLHRVGTPRPATPAEMADLTDYPAFFITRQRQQGKAGAPLVSVPLQRYEIHYAIPTRQFRVQPGIEHAQQDTLEFAAAAYDRDGYLLNGSIEHATSTRKGAATAYQAVQDFDVPTDTASIVLAVRDVDTGRIGNMEIVVHDAANATTPSVARNP